MSRDTTSDTDRRTYLSVAGATGLAAFAGCVSTTDTEEDAGGESGGSGETNAGGEDDAASDDADESASAGPYQIGMVDSLTGSLSAFGERNQRGVELALGRVNEQGIDGRDLELTVEDSESENQGVSRPPRSSSTRTRSRFSSVRSARASRSPSTRA